MDLHRRRGAFHDHLLNTRYLRPVLLQTPLRLLARIAASKDRKITVEGSISTEAAPDTTLVSAEALFLEPDPEQARPFFLTCSETCPAPAVEAARDTLSTGPVRWPAAVHAQYDLPWRAGHRRAEPAPNRRSPW